MEFNRLLSQAISFYGELDKKKKNVERKNEKIDLTKYETIVTENNLKSGLIF